MGLGSGSGSGFGVWSGASGGFFGRLRLRLGAELGGRGDDRLGGGFDLVRLAFPKIVGKGHIGIEQLLEVDLLFIGGLFLLGGLGVPEIVVPDLLSLDVLFDLFVLGEKKLGTAVVAVLLGFVDDRFAIGTAPDGH